MKTKTKRVTGDKGRVTSRGKDESAPLVTRHSSLRVRLIPCTCERGCLQCGRRGIDRELVQAMHDEYWIDGLSLAAVGRKHGKSGYSVRELFARRGLAVRPQKPKAWRKKNGKCQFLPGKRHTPKEIAAIIQGMTKITLPEVLKAEWRHWSMPRRGEFIQAVREQVRPFNARPETPFSSNVVPFEYGTPAAIAVEARLNTGKNSQTKVIKIKPSSQGVIYQGKLWFWCGNNRGWGNYQSSMGWSPENGRPQLNRTIWEAAHGRPVPDGQTVIHLDGNKNNLAPENLGLRSRAECAVLNSVQARLKRDPQNPALQVIARRRVQRARVTRRATQRARVAAALGIAQTEDPLLKALAAHQ